MQCISLAEPVIFAARFIISQSPITKRVQLFGRLLLKRAFTAISGPTPAGSPIVIARIICSGVFTQEKYIVLLCGYFEKTEV